jgi:hypothetical protein
MSVGLRYLRKCLGIAGTADHLHNSADCFHTITQLAVSVRHRSPNIWTSNYYQQETYLKKDKNLHLVREIVIVLAINKNMRKPKEKLTDLLSVN